MDDRGVGAKDAGVVPERLAVLQQLAHVDVGHELVGEDLVAYQLRHPPAVLLVHPHQEGDRVEEVGAHKLIEQDKTKKQKKLIKKNVYNYVL